MQLFLSTENLKRGPGLIIAYIDIQIIEIVQLCAARWVKSDHNYNSSVSAMLTELQWSSLQHCCYETRLKLFCTICP